MGISGLSRCDIVVFSRVWFHDGKKLHGRESLRRKRKIKRRPSPSNKGKVGETQTKVALLSFLKPRSYRVISPAGFYLSDPTSFSSVALESCLFIYLFIYLADFKSRRGVFVAAATVCCRPPPPSISQPLLIFHRLRHLWKIFNYGRRWGSSSLCELKKKF